MERIPVGNGGFLIEMSREEIDALNRMSKLSSDITLRAQETSLEHPELTEKVFGVAKQVNEIIHGVVTEYLPIEDAENKIKLILEQDSAA